MEVRVEIAGGGESSGSRWKWGRCGAVVGQDGTASLFLERVRKQEGNPRRRYCKCRRVVGY